MCCGLQKSTIKWIGWLLCLGFLAGAVVCIILAGVNFNTLFSSFKSSGWQSAAAVQLASIIYVIVLCVLGVLTFCCDWWCLTLIVRIIYKLDIVLHLIDPFYYLHRSCRYSCLSWCISWRIK